MTGDRVNDLRNPITTGLQLTVEQPAVETKMSDAELGQSSKESDRLPVLQL